MQKNVLWWKMLKDLFENKKCFKLICGAGNEDVLEVEKLAALYSKAGCRFFDLSAKPEIIAAAKRGLDYSIPKSEQQDYYLCVSVGIKGDPHVRKAQIDRHICVSCGQCAKICPQRAIYQDNVSYIIDTPKCIGCGKCESVCVLKCITMYSENKDLKEILPPIVKLGIDCIELHAIVEDDEDVREKWDYINEIFDGMLGICVDRSKLGDEKLVKRVQRLLINRKPYTTIIQADGAPMSGGKDDFKTTLQAVAAAEIFQSAKLPAYTIISGGTNSKSTELAKLCGLSIDGVAIGSYARKIVKDLLDREDFLQNEEIFNQALSIAENLVNTSIKYL